MKAKIMVLLFSVLSLALTLAALCGISCPAQGCPACKMLGK